MTQARKTLVDPTHAASYHCVSRCVRRAWLCGFDDYFGKSFEHRKPWVERRILELGDIFACGIYAYAVMSNHYHLVVHMSPATSMAWTAEEVARRWVKLYPTGKPEADQLKMQAIVANEALLKLYRCRLTDLSWLMKSINEPIARRANAEDKVNGRFWQGRFKCQLLRDERALLAAMTYVDLNPIRANMAPGLNRSKHTSLRKRYREALRNSDRATQPLLAMTGANSYNAPLLTNADYLELVDFTGRLIHPGKRGAIKESEPKALTKLGIDARHWSARVKGIGNGYWRVVAEVEDLIDLALQFKQRTLYGIGFARQLIRA